MKTTYFLAPEEYDHLVTADDYTPLKALFPNGVTFEIDECGEVVNVRQPICGDNPELMNKIEAGLKSMNKALIDSGEFD